MTAVTDHGLADPRKELRDRLRWLKGAHPEAFERAVRYYEERTLPQLAEGDPLAAWVEYARELGELTAEGRVVSVDATGRARAWSGEADLVLFVPSDDRETAFAALSPAEPSPAQRATYDLLVRGRFEL